MIDLLQSLTTQRDLAVSRGDPEAAYKLADQIDEIQRLQDLEKEFLENMKYERQHIATELCDAILRATLTRYIYEPDELPKLAVRMTDLLLKELQETSEAQQPRPTRN